MDTRLKIYKAAGRTVLCKKSNFDVSYGTDVTIDFAEPLVVGKTYEVQADFTTQQYDYLALYDGNTLIASFNDTSSSHRTSTRTFVNANNGVESMTLRMVISGASPDVTRVHSLKLSLYSASSSTDPRYVAEKWEFHDSVMGERYIMFTAKSPVPIDWRLNDYAEYRGQRYYLNYIPSCVQRGRSGDVGDSFTYENVKMEDEQGKLGDCMLLDVTPTTGDYIASQGTNYTGSSVFTIFCAETVVTMVDYGGNTYNVALSPVEYIGGLIQANLNRLYPHDNWRVNVNPNLPHLDDKVLSFNKQYIPDALAMIHDEWDLDYIVIGRIIYIGYTLNNVTDDGNGNVLTFGYGRGYNEVGDDGKALFKIKRVSNSSQKIVTRLRAMGSTKNMPYRYYNEKYELPQSMFVANLQLPDTFATPAVKEENNEERDSVYGLDGNGNPVLRHVLGDSNDAYIDKEDDAENCPDGIREGAAFWDGSDSDLEEIYPTIKSGTYLELRGASIPDKDGTTGVSAYPNYGDNERIDEILDVDEQTTNIGDGILAESDVIGQQELSFNVAKSSKTESVSVSDATQEGNMYVWKGEIASLFTVNVEQSKGTYLMAASTYNVVMRINSNIIPSSSRTVELGYEINLWETPSDGSSERHIGTYQRWEFITGLDAIDIKLPDLPDLRDDMKTGEPPTTQVSEIRLMKKATARAIIQPMLRVDRIANNMTVTWGIVSSEQDVTPTYVWKPTAASDMFVNQPFFLYLKDIGIDMKHLKTTGEDATIHFNTGQCGGMEFKFNPNNVEDATIGNKKGWKIQVNERFVDKTINVYYPNASSPIEAGDQYVLLGIEFPELYIKLAEMRLLAAATQYLADNCETKYTYEPEVSDIYLQQNIDRCEKANHIDKSIYWNLYAGYKFSMKGIPAAENAPLPLVSNITIRSVVIKEGEKYTPQVEIVLNDEVEQSTIKRLTTSVDRIYNSVFNLSSIVISGGSSSNGTLSDIQKLSELRDVAFPTPLRFNDSLIWDGTKWVNINLTSDIDALEGRMDDAELALLSLLTHNHDWKDLVNRPNSIIGVSVGGGKIAFTFYNGDVVVADFSSIASRVGDLEHWRSNPEGAEQAITDLISDVARLAGIVSDLDEDVEDLKTGGSSSSAGVASLWTALGEETAARENADDTLQDNIDAEVSARQSGDTALDSRLTVVENGQFSQVSIRIIPGYGTPSATAVCSNGTLTITFVNIQGIQGEKGDTVIIGNGQNYTLYGTIGYNTDGAMTQKAVTEALTANTDLIDDDNSDFSVKDEDGNTIIRFNGGEVETKKFNSAESPKIDDSISDFSIEDEEGNAIAKFKNGHIKTKNFDSEHLDVEHPVENETGNYDFSIEDEQGNAIFRIGQGHIKTKNFDSSDFAKPKVIYCVGDSTTQGQAGIDNPRDDNSSGASANCYPNRLQDMLGDQWQVVNLGAGGQNTGEVFARCGWLDLVVTTAFTLKGDGTTTLLCSGKQSVTTGVLVDSCASEPANYLLQQGTANAIAQMSTCYVLGVQCALSYQTAGDQTNIYIRRVSSASYDLTIPIGTHITLGGCKGDGIYLIRVGSNDAMRMLSNTDVGNYIAKVKQAASRVEGGRYLIMGMFHGYEPSTTEQVKWSAMNARLSQEFGARYIDGLAYMTSMEAFAALDITPTADADISSARAAQGVKSDEYCMAHGMTPSSFWRASYTTQMQSVDKVHLNYDGYWLMAKMFHDKLKQLNWI